MFKHVVSQEKCLNMYYLPYTLSLSTSQCTSIYISNISIEGENICGTHVQGHESIRLFSLLAFDLGDTRLVAPDFSDIHPAQACGR